MDDGTHCSIVLILANMNKAIHAPPTHIHTHIGGKEQRKKKCEKN